MSSYNLVIANDEETVVAEYTPADRHAEDYQSEAELENEFIRKLRSQGYEYLPIHSEADLLTNLRRQLERLNDYTFTDDEWSRFFKESISSQNEGIVDKTRRIQTDHVQVLRRDDGTSKNIQLIDKKNIHNNRLQVINQYEENEGKYKSRYDVTILVNGLPLVHVELKRRGVAIREAFNQINRYQRESFWAGCGLYEYVQIFVISNGTNTKYYSNTTRAGHLKEQTESGRRKSQKTSNSFEFTSYWADAKNRTINDLVDFTKTFFAQHTILGILTRYCIFTTQQILMVMRPYQIVATERILNRILVATNYHWEGTTKAGGYIWHTTGSGKTLTSFKTSQLASLLPFIDKVLFVVDRKDLDHQTKVEYDKFEKDSANASNSTRELVANLRDPTRRIVITTIQKLAIFVHRFKDHPIYNQHVVIIFDECHRSQFGDMHRDIAKAFKKYHLFGFTGTPIFAENAGPATPGNLIVTTPQRFGDQLHTYNIVDAINDGNVLPFKMTYNRTIREKEDIEDKDVAAIDTEKALNAPERLTKVVEYILDNYDRFTLRNSTYELNNQRVAGFNSMFAVSSIPVAIRYYKEFRRQLAERNRKLTVAVIFSFAPNEEDADESLDTQNLDASSRDALESAIQDYNQMFKDKTNFSTSAEQFQKYYDNISLRMKKRELDLLIVVNMFLTGFDATTLNTLWVDKNLKMHGLIQAYSRTNRILNSVKTHGNIVCFRNLRQATDDALALFGDKNVTGLVLLKDFDSYYHGYDDEEGKHHPGYTEIVEELKTRFPVGQPIVGEEEEKDFVRLFGALLKLRNTLTAFDEFEPEKDLSKRDLQDYQSQYIDIYQNRKKTDNGPKEDITDDVEFEIELIQQVEINIDYILMLVAQYHADNCQNKELVVEEIRRAVDSTLQLRSKKELIESFIDSLTPTSDVDSDWRTFVDEQEEADLNAIIEEEHLKPEETREFVANAFRDGILRTTGTDISEILPPVSRFSKGGGRLAKKQAVLDKLQRFFEKFFGLIHVD